MTEREKMTAGEPYNTADPALVIARRRARDLTRALNATRDAEALQRQSILRAVRDRR